jgi:tripartite-type tricarboxylate transporter receptor subunit TctC
MLWQWRCTAEGVVGPAGMPRPIVDKLAEQIGKRVTYSPARDKLAAIGLESLSRSTPDGFAASIKAEIDRWAVIVRNSGVELE